LRARPLEALQHGIPRAEPQISSTPRPEESSSSLMRSAGETPVPTPMERPTSLLDDRDSLRPHTAATATDSARAVSSESRAYWNTYVESPEISFLLGELQSAEAQLRASSLAARAVPPLPRYASGGCSSGSALLEQGPGGGSSPPRTSRMETRPDRRPLSPFNRAGHSASPRQTADLLPRSPSTASNAGQAPHTSRISSIASTLRDTPEVLTSQVGNDAAVDASSTLMCDGAATLSASAHPSPELLHWQRAMADVVRSSEQREALALERARAAEAEAAACREECAAARAALQDVFDHRHGVSSSLHDRALERADPAQVLRAGRSVAAVASKLWRLQQSKRVSGAAGLQSEAEVQRTPPLKHSGRLAKAHGNKRSIPLYALPETGPNSAADDAMARLLTEMSTAVRDLELLVGRDETPFATAPVPRGKACRD